MYVKPKKKISPYIGNQHYMLITDFSLIIFPARLLYAAHTANNKELVEAKKKLIKYRDDKEKSSKISSKDQGSQQEDNYHPAALVIPSVEGDTSARRAKKKVQQQTRLRMHHKKQAEEENYENGDFTSDEDTRDRFLPELSANSKGGTDGRRGSVVPSSLPAIVEDGADSDSYSDIGAHLVSSVAQTPANMQQVSSSIPSLPKIDQKSTTKATMVSNSKGII